MFKNLEFKKALQELSEKEKDVLLFRLLKKDKILAEKLFFELVDTDSVADKRIIMEKQISNTTTLIATKKYSLDYIVLELRRISGSISHHLKITKDKYGEISLNLQMLNEIIEKNSFSLTYSRPQKSVKFYNYVIARCFKILLLIAVQHEDLFLDFKADIIRLGTNLAQNKMLSQVALSNQLDINWLLDAEIPTNILQIHKELKAAGLLR